MTAALTCNHLPAGTVPQRRLVRNAKRALRSPDRQAINREHDPHRQMNPGVLGL